MTTTITEPLVFLVGGPNWDNKGVDRFVGTHTDGKWWGDADEAGVSYEYQQAAVSDAEVLVELGGRLCYMSYDKPRPGGTGAYIKHIMEVGHGSVLEHANWTFIFTGVSRTLTHELVRHRAGFAYSQLSQRYVDESVAEYVCPDVIVNDPELFDVWHDAVKHAHAAYVKLADKLTAKLAPTGLVGTELRKAARQAARSVLPNATETKIQVTANARAWRHFLETRGSKHAEPEIRKLAVMVWEVLKEDSPFLFGDYTKMPLPDGSYELTTLFWKV